MTSTQNVDLADIDISANGLIAAASTNGEIFVTNTDFSVEMMFDASTTGSTNYYVGFTTAVTAIPEPSTVLAMILIAGVFAVRLQRTRRRQLCLAPHEASSREANC